MDFRWHRTTPSPHWSVIPPLKRIQGLPEEIQNAGWNLILPVKIDCSIVNNLGLEIESKIDSLILAGKNEKSKISEEIVEEEEL